MGEGGGGWGSEWYWEGGAVQKQVSCVNLRASNNCKLGECIRWGRGGVGGG